MKNPFWQSHTYRIIQAMKATGNGPGLIEKWKKNVEAWASNPANDSPDARAVRAWLPFWQSRPLYTAEELVPIWPILGIALGLTNCVHPQKSAQRLSFELDYGGLPSRIIDGQRYFIVERIHEISKEDCHAFG